MSETYTMDRLLMDYRAATAQLHRECVALRAECARLREEATTDALTGLPNRRAAERALGRALSRKGRSGQPFSVLVLDIDHFKRVNDEGGHERGDWVLQAVARALRACVRANDVAARWGGEEFLVVTEQGPLGAEALAERIRLQVALVAGVTCSVGVAPHLGSQPADACVRAADEALYAAKMAGRDCVVVAS